MAQPNHTEKMIQEAIELGRRNQSLLPKVQAWCSHLSLKDVSGGMVAAHYRIPISVSISCPHAAGGFESMNLESSSRDFIIQHCRNCSFHSPANLDNFGTEVFNVFNEQREAQHQQQLQEAEAKNELRENIKTLLATQKSTAEIPQVSILKLIELLETAGNKKETTQKLLEASRLQPGFFTDAAMEVLSSYFTDEEINEDCFQIVRNILSATGKKPANCLKHAIRSIQENENFDGASMLFSLYINAENLHEHNATIESLLGRLRYERFPGEPFEEKTYQHSETFFIGLLAIDETYLISLFSGQLSINEKSNRINCIGLLEKLVLADKGFGLKLLSPITRSLELEDDQYMTSADKVTCSLIAKIIAASGQQAYDIVNTEKDKLSHAAELAFYSVYDYLLKDKHFITANPSMSSDIVSLLLKVGMDKSLDKDIREQAINALFYSREDLGNLGKHYFDSLLGAFIQLIEEYKSFKWYLQELETKKISTFNPLAGMNHWDIHSEELKINNFRSHIKDCLTEVIRNNQPVYVTEIYRVLLPMESEADGLLKKELIGIIRKSCKDPVILSRFIPRLYDLLFDPHDKGIRVEAIRLLDHLVSSVPQVVTTTLRDAIDIFLDDNDPEIRGEAVVVLESIIEAAGEKVTTQQIQQALKALSDKTIFVHKKAFPICHDLAPHLETSQRVTFFIALANFEPYYKDKPDFDVCRQIINCMIAVAGNNTHLGNHIIRNYIVPYCSLDDVRASKDFLDMLHGIAGEFPQYQEDWLKSALAYLQRSERDRYNPSFDSRNIIYADIYKLSYKLVSQNSTLLLETAKLIAAKDPYDAVNFLYMFSHFELHGLCSDLCDELLKLLPDNMSNASFIQAVTIFKLFAQLEIQVAKGSIDPRIIEQLENETKKTNN